MARTSDSSRLLAVALGVSLAVALAARLYAATTAQNVARDAGTYINMARELSAGNAAEVCRHYQYHPGYPAVVAVVAKVFGADWPSGWAAAGRGVSIAMSLIALLALYYIAAKVFNRKVAVATVLLAGLSQAFVEVSADAISDAQALAMAMISIALAMAASGMVRKPSWLAAPLAILSGLAAAGGYLTRPEAMAAGAISFALVLGACLPRGRARAIGIVAALLLAATTAAGSTPYMVAIGAFTQKKSMSDFVLAGGGQMLATATVTAEYAQAAFRVVDRLVAAMGVGMFIPAAICWAGWLLGTIRPTRISRELLLWPNRAAAFAMFAPQAIIWPLLAMLEFKSQPEHYISSRHLLLPAMMLAPCAGACLAAIANIIADRFSSLRAPVALAVMAVLVAGAVAPRVFRPLHEGKNIYRQTGELIHRQFGEGRTVLCFDGSVPFWAGSPAMQYHSGSQRPYPLAATDLASADALLARARPADGLPPYDFIAIDSRILARPRSAPNIVNVLSADPRFTSIPLPPQTGGEHIWLFRLAESKESK